VTLHVGTRRLRCPHSPAPDLGARVQIWPVNLLGTRVEAWANLSRREHRRRCALGLGAVTDPALLESLLDLPLGEFIDDPVAWAETAGQPEGIVERADDRCAVRRFLEPPLTVTDIIVPGQTGRTLKAVQDASLFARFSSRWVAAEEENPSDSVVMEAKLCGVGLLNHQDRVLFAAESSVIPVIDGWTWLLWEKCYRRWLRMLSSARETVSPVPATGGAIEAPTS
jgi:hypothetical protein